MSAIDYPYNQEIERITNKIAMLQQEIMLLQNKRDAVIIERNKMSLRKRHDDKPPEDGPTLWWRERKIYREAVLAHRRAQAAALLSTLGETPLAIDDQQNAIADDDQDARRGQDHQQNWHALADDDQDARRGQEHQRLAIADHADDDDGARRGHRDRSRARSPNRKRRQKRHIDNEGVEEAN